MVDLVAHDAVRPPDAIELLVQLVERVSGPESPPRESTGALRKHPLTRLRTTAPNTGVSIGVLLVGSDYSPTLLSALFNSKSSRTTSLSATRYRRGDVFGTSSMSSTSHKRSV